LSACVPWKRIRRASTSLRASFDIGSRIVEVVGLARNPGGDWMKQMARNLLDADDGFLRGKRYLILNRDPLDTKEFRQMLRGAG
jgi:putative transposase